VAEFTKREKQILEDEINIRQYIDVIIKRRNIVILTCIASLVVAVIVSFFMPKVYEASSTIRLGAVSTVLIQKPEATEILQSQKLIDSALAIINKTDNVSAFGKKKMLRIEEVKDTSFINVKINYPDPVLAANICNVISEQFVSLGKEKYQQNIRLLTEQINELEIRYHIIKGEIDNFNSKIANEKMNPNYPLLQNTITNYETLTFSLREKIYTFKQDVLRSVDFEVFEAAYIPKSPIKPNIRLIVTMATTLGLISGLFIAFFVEYALKTA
jgi:uncharacterized protein involved in exopolysaccharide biosynthesis